MEEKKKVILTGLIFFLVVILGVAIYYFFFQRGKEAPTGEIAEKPPAQAPLEEFLREKEKELLELAQVELDKSDELVRNLAKELSSHPKLAAWLISKDLIRKFTAGVDNIANGLSPNPQIDFFSIKEDFKVLKREGLYYLDPESYHRYDLVADVFLSLDTEGCVKLYRQLKPLIQDAYRDLGYPAEDFQKTLVRAIEELLNVPVVERDILVEKKIVTYMMSDSRLENLSETQKHLLRMGPENVHIIQEKLREMAAGLGIPREKLPRQ